VQNGVHITEKAFSQTFRLLFAKYMGPELCPRKWRQVAVSIGREFIPPHLHVGGGGNNTNDLVLAHSTPQSRSRYGLVCNDIPTLTNDAVCEYRDVCHAWWDVVGVGFATAPPEPLRMIRLGALSINTARLNNPSLPGNPFPDVQGIITSAINEALRDFKDELVKEILPSLVQQIASTTLDLRSSILAVDSGDSPVPLFVPSSPLPPSSAVPSTYDGDDDSWTNPEYRNEGSHSVIDISSEEPHLASKRLLRYNKVVRSNKSVGEVLVPSTSDGILGSSSEPHFPTDIEYPVPNILSPAVEADMSLLTDEEVALLSEVYLARMARQGIRAVLCDPHAKEKSPEQLEAIKAVLVPTEDLCVVLETGGGKTMIWLVVAKMRPKRGCIIVIPHILVLEEQLKHSQDHGIRAFQYTASTTPPADFQQLFMQPETGGCKTFNT